MLTLNQARQSRKAGQVKGALPTKRRKVTDENAMPGDSKRLKPQYEKDSMLQSEASLTNINDGEDQVLQDLQRQMSTMTFDPKKSKQNCNDVFSRQGSSETWSRGVKIAVALVDGSS